MDFLLYDIRVAVLIAVFYMFYRLLLSRDSLHQLNRFVLLGTAVASFVLPLCVITVHHTEVLTVVPTTSSVSTAVSKAVEPSTPWWQIALPIVFWLGVIITLLYTILSISKVCILISRCEKHRQSDGTVIAVSDEEVSPFSWMHYIVMSRSDYAHPDSAILMHEHEHIRRHHSWDVLLVDILSSLQWFNPAMWMLRSDLRAIHEYEADAAVLSSGVNARQYQYLLVRKAMAAAGYSIANGINHSALKQRITMMNTHKDNKYSWLKALYVLPIVAISLFATAKTVTDYKVVDSAKPMATEAKTVNTKPVTTESMSTSVEKIVEQQVTPKDSVKLSELLVLVDGKEIPYSELGNISPSDISAIGVIKNKAFLAKYGERGKNGIISITTKKNASSTEKNTDVNGVFVAPEEIPHFNGGSSALMQYLAQNVRYPAKAQECGVQGRVVVSFIVNEDGNLSDVQVVHNGAVGASTDEVRVVGYDKKEKETKISQKDIDEARADIAQEAVRVVKNMPAWVPGKQDGKPVKAKYNIPVSFKLQ